MDLELTQHFKKRWSERIGGQAIKEAVATIIRQSVSIQAGAHILRADGRVYRALSIYWHPDLEIIIKVDGYKAVTVLSRDILTTRKKEKTNDN